MKRCSILRQINNMNEDSRKFQHECTQRFERVESTVNDSIHGLHQKIENQENSIISQMKQLFASYNKQDAEICETPKRPRVGEHPNDMDDF